MEHSGQVGLGQEVVGGKEVRAGWLDLTGWREKVRTYQLLRGRRSRIWWR